MTRPPAGRTPRRPPWVLLLVAAAALTHACALATAEPSPRVRLFVYHSDEDELISDWLLYHASIFGASNIHVVDHNSTLPAVVETLREWERRGVEVIHTPPGFSFADKALLLTEVMQGVSKQDPTAHFLVPLDADEFVVSVGEGGVLEAQREAILDRFARLPLDGFKYKFEQVVAGICTPDVDRSDRRAVDARHLTHPGTVCTSKTFFLSASFLSTDQGNHEGETTADADCAGGAHVSLQCPEGHCYHLSQLAAVHFGDQAAIPYESYERKARRGFAAYAHQWDAATVGPLLASMEPPAGGCAGPATTSEECGATGRTEEEREEEGEEEGEQAVPAGCESGRGVHYCHFVKRLYEWGNARMRRAYARQQAAACRFMVPRGVIADALEALDAVKG